VSVSEIVKVAYDFAVVLYDAQASPDTEEWTLCLSPGDFAWGGGGRELVEFLENGLLATCGDVSKPAVRPGNTIKGEVSFSKHLVDFFNLTGETTPGATLMDICYSADGKTGGVPGGYVRANWTSASSGFWAINIKLVMLGSTLGETDRTLTWTVVHPKSNGNIGFPATLQFNGAVYGNNGTYAVS